MKAKNSILAIFIVSLFAAPVLATPTTALNEDHFKDFNLCKLKNMYSTLAASEKDNTIKPPFIQFMKIATFDLQDLALSYVKKAKDISELLLKDAVIISSKQPEIVKFKHNVEEFQHKYSTCSGMAELFDLVDLYANATSPYYEMATKDTLNADSRIIYDVLKKYSLQELNAEYENRFLNEFAYKFGQKVNVVEKSLKKEDRGEECTTMCPVTISGSNNQMNSYCFS